MNERGPNVKTIDFLRLAASATASDRLTCAKGSLRLSYFFQATIGEE